MFRRITSLIMNLLLALVLLSVPAGTEVDSLYARREPLPVLDSDRIKDLIYEKTNEQRKRQGLEPYRYMEQMEKLARIHTKNMIEQRFFSHTDRQRRGPAERMQETYPRFIGAVGENIAYFTGKTEEEVASKIMKGWMRSRGHRKNILHRDFRFLGVSVMRSENGRYYATQSFANPIAWMRSKLPDSVTYGKSRSFIFQFQGDFPGKELDVFVHFPDKQARFPAGKMQYYVGAGPHNPEWIGKNRFRVTIDFSYGKGDYEIRMGTNGQTYIPGLVIPAK